MLDLNGKHVLFVATKNMDYLRNVQEVNMLKEKAEQVDTIGYDDKSYVKRLIKIYSKLLFSSLRKYDCIFIGFAPQLILPWFGWKMRKKMVVMDFFISLYDTFVFDRKRFKKDSVFAHICKWIDRKSIHRADYVICDTAAHGNYFSDEFFVPREKIHTFYLEADDAIYYERNIKRPDYLENKYVVLYFGSVLPLQGLEVILEALNILKDNLDIYFYIIGPVKDKMEIVKSDNIEYIEWLSQEQLAEHIAYADLCLAGHFNASIEKAKRTIPGKAYIYEAMGKIMVLGENSANHELYQEDAKHYFVKMGDASALASTILKIKAINGK